MERALRTAQDSKADIIPIRSNPMLHFPGGDRKGESWVKTKAVWWSEFKERGFLCILFKVSTAHGFIIAVLSVLFLTWDSHRFLLQSSCAQGRQQHWQDTCTTPTYLAPQLFSGGTPWFSAFFMWKKMSQLIHATTVNSLSLEVHTQ